MAHEVFISHAVEDKQVADEVCRALEAEGVRCWVAPRDIPPGMDYEESIVEAISRSPVLVLILSPHSNASAHVRREIQCAFVENSPTRVIPFRIADVPYSKALSYYLGSAQWIDASQPPVQNHLQRLVQNVRARLPQQGTQMPTTRPTNPAPDDAHAAGEVSGAKRPLPTAWIVGGAAALVLAAVIAFVTYNGFGGRPGGGAAPNINISEATPTPQSTPAPTPSAPPQSTPTPTRTPIRNFNLRLPANVNRRLPRNS